MEFPGERCEYIFPASHERAGQRCGGTAVHGSKFCRHHGGKKPEPPKGPPSLKDDLENIDTRISACLAELDQNPGDEKLLGRLASLYRIKRDLFSEERKFMTAGGGDLVDANVLAGVVEAMWRKFHEWMAKAADGKGFGGLELSPRRLAGYVYRDWQKILERAELPIPMEYDRPFGWPWPWSDDESWPKGIAGQVMMQYAERLAKAIELETPDEELRYRILETCQRLREEELKAL